MKLEVLQTKIEFLSQLKFRNGFSKWVIKAMCFFNLTLDDLTIENSITIIKFVNSCNSKCSLSYWILKYDLTIDDARIKSTSFKENFINSSYKFTSRAEVASKHVYENKSRGYSGYLKIGDEERYCRSSNEFIAWNLLSSRYGIENIKYEHITFNVNGLFNYRPDFFIYNESVLKKIVEIKNNDFIESSRHIEIRKFFESIGIEYEIITDLKTRIDLDLKTKLEFWKNSDRVVAGNKGDRNPRYGVTLSDETKKKISEKAMERCKNPDYIIKISESQKQRYIDDPNARVKCSEIAKKREQNMTGEQRQVRIQNRKKTWDATRYMDVVCLGNCGQIIHIKKTQFPYCKSCKRVQTKKQISSKMGISAIEIFFENWVLDSGTDFIFQLEHCELNKINDFLLIRKREINRLNAKVGLNSIVKYFGSFDNLITKLKEKYDCNHS